MGGGDALQRGEPTGPPTATVRYALTASFHLQLRLRFCNRRLPLPSRFPQPFLQPVSRAFAAVSCGPPLLQAQVWGAGCVRHTCRRDSSTNCDTATASSIDTLTTLCTKRTGSESPISWCPDQEQVHWPRYRPQHNPGTARIAQPSGALDGGRTAARRRLARKSRWCSHGSGPSHRLAIDGRSGRSSNDAAPVTAGGWRETDGIGSAAVLRDRTSCPTQGQAGSHRGGTQQSVESSSGTFILGTKRRLVKGSSPNPLMRPAYGPSPPPPAALPKENRQQHRLSASTMPRTWTGVCFGCGNRHNTQPPHSPHKAPIQPPHIPHTAPTKPPYSPHTSPTKPPYSPHTAPTQPPHSPPRRSHSPYGTQSYRNQLKCPALPTLKRDAGRSYLCISRAPLSGLPTHNGRTCWTAKLAVPQGTVTGSLGLAQGRACARAAAGEGPHSRPVAPNPTSSDQRGPGKWRPPPLRSACAPGPPRPPCPSGG